MLILCFCPQLALVPWRSLVDFRGLLFRMFWRYGVENTRLDGLGRLVQLGGWPEPAAFLVSISWCPLLCSFCLRASAATAVTITAAAAHWLSFPLIRTSSRWVDANTALPTAVPAPAAATGSVLPFPTVFGGNSGGTITAAAAATTAMPVAIPVLVDVGITTAAAAAAAALCPSGSKLGFVRATSDGAWIVRSFSIHVLDWRIITRAGTISGHHRPALSTISRMSI